MLVVFATTMIRQQLLRLLPTGARRMWRQFKDSSFKWRYVDNWAPTLAHRLQPQGLDGERRRVVETLARDGIAITTCEQLFGSDAPMRELVATVARLEHEQRAQIERQRQAAAQHSEGHKGYMHMFVGARDARLPRDHGFVAFAQRDALHAVADTYFGMRTELRQVDVWYNFATPHELKASQLWHRDREDRHILKVFVYLDDVDDEMGPLTYALGSHQERANEPESFREPGHGNARSTNEQMAAVIPTTRWKKAVGPRGTIVFADTAGLHRGGDTRRGERHVFVCMYTSSACREQLLTIER